MFFFSFEHLYLRDTVYLSIEIARHNLGLAILMVSGHARRINGKTRDACCVAFRFGMFDVA